MKSSLLCPPGADSVCVLDGSSQKKTWSKEVVCQLFFLEKWAQGTRVKDWEREEECWA